jgi:hypothetical protein
MSHELLEVKPLTTVPCALCGKPGQVEDMTTDGDGQFYCGRLSQAALTEFRAQIKACDERQQSARANARLAEMAQAAAEVQAADPAAAEGGEPARSDTAEPAETTETPAGDEPAAETDSGQAGDAS